MPTTAQLPEAASVPAILLLGTQFISEFVLSIQELAYPGSVVCSCFHAAVVTVQQLQQRPYGLQSVKCLLSGPFQKVTVSGTTTLIWVVRKDILK